MNDDLQQAQLMIAVRALCLEMTCDLDQMLQEVLGADIDLTEQFLNHRLHQIANSVAWHESRRTPAARLQELARELARLWQKTRLTNEGQFYLRLLRRMGLQDELTQISVVLQQQIKLIQQQINEEPNEKQRTIQARRERGRLQQYRAEQQMYTALIDATASQSQCPDQAPENTAHQTEAHAVWLPSVLGEFATADQQRWLPTVRLWVALAVVQSLRLLVQSSDLRQAIQKNGGTLCP